MMIVLIITAVLVLGLMVVIPSASAAEYDITRAEKVAQALSNSAEASSILNEYQQYLDSIAEPVVSSLAHTVEVVEKSTKEVMELKLECDTCGSDLVEMSGTGDHIGQEIIEVEVDEPTVEVESVRAEPTAMVIDSSDNLVSIVVDGVELMEAEPVYVKTFVYEKQGVVEGSPFANPDHPVRKVIMVEV